MNKLKTSLAFLFFIFLNACPSWAQPAQTITLKDGTQIKGDVTAMQDGIYTIHSPSLGTLNIPEEKISAINADDNPLPKAAVEIKAPAENLNKNQIMQKAQEVQGQVMQDPQLMEQVQKMAEDPKMRELISDPSLLQDLLSGDAQRIQNNEKLRELFNNEEMQALINEIQQKYSPQNPEAEPAP